jgi:hypothetical protein
MTNPINTRTRINLFLLVVMGGIGALLYLRPGKTPESLPALTTLRGEDISRITVLRTLKPDIRLALRDTGWMMTAPIEIDASMARVNALLGLATTPSLARYSARERQLADFGLAPSLSTVVLNTTPIHVGRVNPVNNRRYLLIDETVHLVQDNLYDIYTAEAASYASNRLVPAGRKLTRVQVPGLYLVQNAKGGWSVQFGDKRLAAKQIRELIEAWQHATALWVQRYGGVQIGDQISLYLDDGVTRNFHIIATEPQLILASPELNLQYHLPARYKEQLVPNF